MAADGKDKKGRIKSPTFKITKPKKVKVKKPTSKSKRTGDKKNQSEDSFLTQIPTGATRDLRGLKHGGKVKKFQLGGVADLTPPRALETELEADALGNLIDPGIDESILKKDLRSLNRNVTAEQGLSGGATAGLGLAEDVGGLAQKFAQTGPREQLGVTTGGGALKGAAKGAALGSVIPGIGTGAGAIVGGLVGGLTSFLGGKERQREANVQRGRESQAAASAAAFSRGAGREVTATQEDIARRQAEGEFSLSSRLGRVFARGGKVMSPDKAKKILKDGTIRGKALTRGQRGLFGLIAGGGTPNELAKGGKVFEFSGIPKTIPHGKDLKEMTGTTNPQQTKGNVNHVRAFLQTGGLASLLDPSSIGMALTAKTSELAKELPFAITSLERFGKKIGSGISQDRIRRMGTKQLQDISDTSLKTRFGTELDVLGRPTNTAKFKDRFLSSPKRSILDVKRELARRKKLKAGQPREFTKGGSAFRIKNKFAI